MYNNKDLYEYSKSFLGHMKKNSYLKKKHFKRITLSKY